MSVLERDGFIAQPHTSAGRVPTDTGYRYYVDHLASATSLTPTERRRIAEFFTGATMAVDELCAQTSLLLARVTDHAAVVVGPPPEAVVVRGAHLVRLQPGTVLAMVVLSNGAVEKEFVAVDEALSEATIAEASARFAQRVDGLRLADVPTFDAPEGTPPGEALAASACAAVRTHLDRHRSDPLYVGGASRLAAEPEAFSTATVARLIELLEQHVVLATVLREMLGPGITIRIGAENSRDDLQECSLVLAPVLVEGEAAGTIGVLGPTRMDYGKAQAAVTAVSRQLGRQLSP
jgi:heat-inducible transcriptional repressor